MTEKKEKIFSAALELFAEEGYKSTSTSKVAKLAGVSEGLIFKHFGSKEGLLQAILKMGEEKAKLLYADIVMEPNPKEVIRKTLDMGLEMKGKEAEMRFWKLQFKIKWELEEYGAHKMEPLKRALSNAFKKLNYPYPEQESSWLVATLDGMATRLLLDSDFEIELLISFMKSKYDV